MADADEVADIHVALVRVVSEWTQSELHTQVADAVDVTLDPTAVRALYLIGMNGQALGVGDLAQHASMSRPTTSKVVSRMAAQGMVRTIRTGRTVEVRLTEKGARAYARLVAAGHRMIDEALADWAPGEAAQFRAQLTRFVAALSGASLPPLRGAEDVGASSIKEEP